jgi:hypothetical protein
MFPAAVLNGWRSTQQAGIDEAAAGAECLVLVAGSCPGSRASAAGRVWSLEPPSIGGHLDQPLIVPAIVPA